MRGVNCKCHESCKSVLRISVTIVRDDDVRAVRGWMPAWGEEVYLAALLFVVFTGVAVCMPPHNDTWRDLRAGLEMFTSGRILTTETFSHTAYGTPLALIHEWVSQLLFFGIYHIAGPFLLALTGTACVMAAVAGAWHLVKGSTEARFGWLIVLFLGTVAEWAIRPQVISLALFVVALYLAISARGHDKWLPLLCLAWANVHGAVLSGVIVAGCAVIEAILWSRTRVRRSLLIAAGCAAAPMCSPLGWHYWPQVFWVVRWCRALGIQEFRTAFELAQLPFWALVTALAGLALRPRALANADRGTRILVLVAAIFAVAGATSVRNIPIFVLAAAPAISRLLPARATVRRTQPRPAAASAAIFLLVVLVIATSLVAYAWRDRGAHLGWTPISPPAIDAIRRCDGPLFNTFDDGGALTWFVRDRPVFIDSRAMEAYPIGLLQRSRAADVSGDYQQLFADFHITCAAVATGSVVAQRLAADPSMHTQYADREWTVFRERQPAH
jgi:hypothetical protein